MIRSARSMLLMLALVGIAATIADQSGAQDPKAEVAAEAAADPSYRMGPEDVLDIAVWKEEALKKEVVVRPDGGMSFPLVGDLQAAGKTVVELRDELAKKLAKFIPEPVVSVAVLRVASQKIYVIGRVNKPGDFTVGRYLDVLQALSMAGGLTPFADASDIRVMRRENGKQLVLPFDYSKVSRGENLEQNIPLRTGDVIVVP
jgi:polysaccharide export outer membrane protein